MKIFDWFKNKNTDADNANTLKIHRNSQALEASSSCFMMADENRVIIYANKAVKKLLKEAEVELRKSLPQFSADNLIGQSIDQFHANPSHQMGLLSNLKSTYIADITVGSLNFKLTVNPLFDPEGNNIGSVVEWLNQTTLLITEKFAARMLGSLDSTSTNLMLADPDRKIIYMNKSVEKMLRGVESELQKALPHFSVDKVLNSSMDIFHKNPSHQSSLLENLKSSYEGNIEVGNLKFRLTASPIFAEGGERLGTVVEWLDTTKVQEELHRTTRILEALNGTSTNLMIADPDRNIIYINRSVEAMLRRNENELRKSLPNFVVDKVVGSNIDIFHKNPAHQKGLLEGLQTPYESQIKVGELYFRLIASPIFGKDNERLGTVVEWLDRTEEVFAEQEISNIVKAAASGDFNEKATTEGKQGFMLNVAEGLNSMIEVTDAGLTDIARVLNALAKGDLTERIDSEYQGTYEQLANYCNTTTGNLSNMIGEIRQAAGVINNASSEIAEGNSDLSSRTEEQASSLEETASSMEELTGTVRLNSENANQANSLASEASTVAMEGGETIQKVVATMASINESANKISDIIGVIDGIAFQTNILALNAAVEAARAGEQGRGFAVVASEVRTLAQRSANAAKDIKELISDSVSKIENGNVLVNQSGETMDKVVTSIKRVNDIMSEIAAASAEQATGIDEVGKAISQMDEVTQQNAALVEEAAAAAESLQSQAIQLTERVASFKMSDSQELQQSAAPRKALSSPAPRASKPKERAPTPKAQKKIKPASPKDDEWESF
ncbi:methyl-accepting chemotaxis protein [Paraglaciecola sp. MB-3u-78]|jgi:methyl-accepting chemotaxis protein|uniref:methyl-accepting chemotaxis protein n=1 Tax=Paraglaciecola sp. MB-3u-78 TaxID=2058332 RepID=UPI002691D62B|nr:methyl-accepting chemotaxis protein [Paraglaciecola sp. MB-3u-78]